MRVDALCLDCGEPFFVEIRDGKIATKEPEEMISYVAVPFWKWIENLPYA